MADLYAGNLAVGLAALSVAGLVCALFYPVLAGQPRFARRSTMLAAMRKGGSEEATQNARNIRRAHEFALKAVAESNRSRRTSRLSSRMAAAGLQWPQRRFVACCLVLGAALCLGGSLAGLPPLIALAAAAIGGGLVPWHALGLLARRRREKFLAGFTTAVDMIVRGAKSGLSVVDCLNMVAADGDPLVRKEFGAIAAQLRAGVPLSEAMAKLSAAMPAAEVRFFVLIMSMQSQTGGNLSEALGNLAKVLRDRQRLAQKVRIASAEVKASAIAVGALPFVVIGATMFVSPDYIRILWTDETGRRFLMASAGWMLVGIAVLRRMARIEP